MPVNDSTNIFNATENCAICTVAGLYGRTYSQFIGAFGRSEASFIGSARSMISDFFAKYTGKPITMDNRTALQVEGIEKFFRSTGMQNIRVDGTTTHPLSGNDLMHTLYNYPPGTKYAILIGKSHENSHFAGGAHWFACHRENGVPAMRFIDYQLDTSMTFTDLRHGGVPRSAPLGAPYETNIPVRPWGAKPKTGKDHFVAISFTPPG